MSANRYRPHILVLPEDDANRDIVIGFRRHPRIDFRQFQIEDVAGGWLEVLDLFKSVHIAGLDRNPNRRLVLLIDLDEDRDRLAHAKGEVPERLVDRVFILGVLSEPERLRTDIGKSLEDIGLALATECHQENYDFWSHPLLRHNSAEVARLQERLRPILFPGVAR